VHALAGLPPPRPLTTALTISLGTPDAMGEAAAKAAGRALLKVKLGGDGDPARIAAVRRAAPRAELIVDANESWSAANLAENLQACTAARVTLVEQPLPQSADDALVGIDHPIAMCADESAHDRGSLDRLRGKYEAINIKLDKAGGLTEALRLAEEGERRGFKLMVGCMVATSLSMAPAVLVAQRARVVDLDGPLILARDRPHGLLYEQSLVHPATPALWG
jgi:L-alanine-DL-glutamate epimerase-like enolase superfamily enzyme